MKKLALLLCLCAFTHAPAQKLYVYPAAPIAPRGSYQTITAIVNKVNDKTVTWTSSGGKLVGTNPCIANEPCTIALYTTTPGTYTVTATSNANHAVTAASTVTITPSPTPVATHPRFIITQASLSAMRAKATAKNVMYQGIRANAVSAFNTDNAIWSWSCNGGSGQPSSNQLGNWKENDAYAFAFMALIHPNDPPYNWACYAHDVSIYLMTNDVAHKFFGSSSNWTANANEWSDSSYGGALLPDFLLGSGAVTSSADIAVLHSWLAYMAQVMLNQQGTGAPNTYNQWSTAANPYAMVGMRATGNNYNLSRMLYLVAAGFTFNDNPTDDPALPNTCGATRYQVCPDFTAGSLRAYATYFMGSTLYNYWAAIEDPNVSWQAYNTAFANLPAQPVCENTDGLTHPCFGTNREGESTEGSWYQYSMYRPVEAFNMLRTAGDLDPLVYGPQVSAAGSSYWDLKYISDIEFLVDPPSTVVAGAPQQPSHAFLTTGDTYTYQRMVSDAWAEASLLVGDSETGRGDRANALKWLNFNLAYGGPLGTAWGCTSYCGYDYQIGNGNFSGGSAYDMFVALPAGDPVASLPPDPRPSLPTDLYNGSLNQHLMVRDNWTQGANTLFTYWYNNSLYNHEYNFDGRFDIFANGEYITKGRTIFNDYNFNMMVSSNQNTLAILNSSGSGGSGCNFAQMLLGGGQLPESDQAGLVSLQHSELPGYVAAVGNTTNAYNGQSTGVNCGAFPSYTDVSASSRSMVYLRGSNQVVYYDRAAVGHAASTQALTQVTTGSPTISGSTASWPTRSGKQTAYLTSLLPAAATLSNIGLPCTQCTASWQAQDWEPYAEVQITPAGNPTSSQFLSVLQWGASSFAPAAATLVQSTSGQNFDGARIGSALVLFERSWPTPFTGTTYPASGATTQYLSDLQPNTTYNIAGPGAPTSATTDSAGLLTFTAAGAGNITVGNPAQALTTATPGKRVGIGAIALSTAGACAAAAVATLCARAMRTRQ